MTGQSHGTRARYVAGCRCLPCTDANRDYQRARAAGEVEGLVDAAEARRHLLWLAREGIGLRPVAETTGITRLALKRIRAGERRRIRATTADRILAVHRRRPVRDGQRVDVEPSRRLVDELVAAGHTRSELARRLGYAGRGIQCLAGTSLTRGRADEIATLHAELIRWDPQWQRRDDKRRRQADYRARSTQAA